MTELSFFIIRSRAKGGSYKPLELLLPMATGLQDNAKKIVKDGSAKQKHKNLCSNNRVLKYITTV